MHASTDFSINAIQLALFPKNFYLDNPLSVYDELTKLEYFDRLKSSYFDFPREAPLSFPRFIAIFSNDKDGYEFKMEFSFEKIMLVMSKSS